MQYFEDYAEKAGKAHSEHDLSDLFMQAIERHGYNRLIMCFDTDHDHIEIKADIAITGNFCLSYIDHYKSKEFRKIDPVLEYGLRRSSAFSWEEALVKSNATKQQKEIVRLSNEAGHHNGIYIPIARHNGTGGIGLASSQKNKETKRDYDILTAYCNHFYDSFIRLKLKGRDAKPFSNPLTKGEIEILRWAAEGKTDSAIGDRMCISDSTVETHLRHIYAKLKVPNRTAAVAIAISRKFIYLS